MLTMILAGVLAFCRVAIGLVFVISSISKVRNITQFRQTIVGFNILPASLNAPIAVTFVCGEFAVVVLIVIGGALLVSGFVLAMLLLLIFCGALFSVLARGITTSCNCFGSNEKQVSSSDIWRNAGFILCALGGCILAARTDSLQANANLFVWVFAGLGASAFVTIWLHLGEIVQLVRLS